MTVKELIDKLSEFDPDLEIDFEFEQYSADGNGTIENWEIARYRICDLLENKQCH